MSFGSERVVLTGDYVFPGSAGHTHSHMLAEVTLVFGVQAVVPRLHDHVSVL